MTELFEIIMNYPMQFLAGLGVSSGTIYLFIKIIKGIVAFIFKNKNKLKELAKQKAVANEVAKTLNLDEAINSLKTEFRNIILTLETEIKTIKSVLNEIKNKPEIPMELKAYIETVLGQDGSEELQLFYEQIKNNLIQTAKKVEVSDIKIDTESLKEHKQKLQNSDEKVEKTIQLSQNNNDDVQNSPQISLESEQNIKELKKSKKHSRVKKKIQEDEDISYA